MIAVVWLIDLAASDAWNATLLLSPNCGGRTDMVDGGSRQRTEDMFQFGPSKITTCGLFAKLCLHSFRCTLCVYV